MNRIFHMTNPIIVPDGTIVNGFMNALDNTSNLEFDLLDSLSIAGGILAPHALSKIQILPLVTQNTFVLRGHLTVKMKDAHENTHYTLNLAFQQAALTKPGTFLQLINDTDETCELLYIITPSYVFELRDDKVQYDDSVVFDENWEMIESRGWQSPKPYNTPTEREAAIVRLKHKLQ